MTKLLLYAFQLVVLGVVIHLAIETGPLGWWIFGLMYASRFAGGWVMAIDRRNAELRTFVRDLDRP